MTTHIPKRSNFVQPGRPTVQTFTTRPLTEPDTEGGMTHHARWPVVVCVVKTGSERMRRNFERFALLAGLEFEPIGADGGRGAYAPDAAGTIRETERGAFLVPTSVNACVTSEYLVWGHPDKLLQFLDNNTGDNRCLASWFQPVTVRVGMTASGSGTITPTTAKRIREMQRSKTERTARETREELNRLHTSNPASPYHADEQRRMEDRIDVVYGALFDSEDWPEDIVSKVRKAIRKILREKDRNGEDWTRRPFTRAKVFDNM